MATPPHHGPFPALAGFAAAMLASAAAAVWLMAAWDPQRMLFAATWLVVGLVVVPIAFAVALCIVAVLLSALLAMLAAPAWLVGRPTGLCSVLVDLWQLAGYVLPGYVRALRRVRRPMLWGCVVGFVAGVVGASLGGGLAWSSH